MPCNARRTCWWSSHATGFDFRVYSMWTRKKKTARKQHQQLDTDFSFDIFFLYVWSRNRTIPAVAESGIFFFLTQVSFSIHYLQNLGSLTPAVSFNWCGFKTQIASMVMRCPDPALHMVGPGRIRNLWSRYWCKWYNRIMLMTRHWITLVDWFNWLSVKPSYGPIWDRRLIGWYRCCLMWFLGGFIFTAKFTCCPSVCLVWVQLAGFPPPVQRLS